VSLGWGLLFLADSIEIWHAVILLTLHGLAGVLWGPASQLLIHDIVGREELQSAVRLNATSRSLGILMAPAIGGGLMLLAGPATGLLVNAVIYLPLIWWLWKTPHGSRKQVQRTAAAGMGGFMQAFAILRPGGGATAPSCPWCCWPACPRCWWATPSKRRCRNSRTTWGTEQADFSYSVLLAASAAARWLGGLALESRGLLVAKPQTAIVLTILWCLAIAGFAAATSYPLAVGLMLVAGFLNISFQLDGADPGAAACAGAACAGASSACTTWPAAACGRSAASPSAWSAASSAYTGRWRCRRWCCSPRPLRCSPSRCAAAVR